MRKIGELSVAGKKIAGLPAIGKTFAIYYDEKARTNRYRVYEKYWESGKGWRKHLIDKYGDLLSCVLLVEEYVYENNEETRE